MQRSLAFDSSAQLVHSNLDNQIDHLAHLLKWRMDRSDIDDPSQALEYSVGELHNKMLANYTRWVRHVNLQRFSGNETDPPAGTFKPPSQKQVSSLFSSFDGDPHQSLPVSALSGDVWDFIACGASSLEKKSASGYVMHNCTSSCSGISYGGKPPI